MAVVVLDRDGVINKDSSSYIKSAAEWEVLPGSLEAIKTISIKGYRIFVATNQAGIARGLFGMPELQSMHQKLFDLVKQEGGRLSGIVFCPHHPDDGCVCRKPGIGMLNMIERAAGESLTGQFFVGDSAKDLSAGRRKGCRQGLVLTGNGQNTLQHLADSEKAEVSVFDNLMQFADFLPAAT